MGKAVPVNKNSNAATMNAVVKYFSWNMKKCLLSRSKRTSGRDGNERCRRERYGQSTQNCKRYCFRSFKKTKNFPKQVNENFLEKVKSEEPTQIDVYIEMDEMWSFCHDKSHQIWLWWAVDHKTNTPLAYIFGTREYKYLDELLKLLSEFNIGTVYADNNFAYSSRISPDKLVTGKRNTQQIERDHLTLRTRIKRLARKTICFSKSPEIHKAVIGTFINIHFFGRTFDKSLFL